MDEDTGDFKYDSMKRYFSDDVFNKIKETFSTCHDRTGKKRKHYKFQTNKYTAFKVSVTRTTDRLKHFRRNHCNH